MAIALIEQTCTPCHGNLEIRFGWGFAAVSLHMKKIKRLNENEFIIAAKLDRIAADGAASR
jgi:pterin-4a-carbinolamine dehydratase